MPTRRPDNLPRGWLAETIRARAKRPKITDPREREAFFAQLGIDLPPGANTLRRRTRY
jgi:hypothetical protein